MAPANVLDPTLPSERPIPIFHSLEQIYPDSHLDQAKRWNELLEGFERVYGKKAEWVCRAPGRVNLIGEHIDYSAFPVLPTAVEADILIACAPRSGPSSARGAPEGAAVVVDNLDGRYPMGGFTPVRKDEGGWELGVDKRSGGWVNFVKAGNCGVLENHVPDGHEPTQADLLYTGSVPDGAGLSSSAAMVVASTLAFLVLNGKHNQVDSGGLVRVAVENERVVGVNSGGMDQAASVLSTASSALLIDFYPQLEAVNVPLPSSARFVIANTLTTHNLLETGKRHYNLRVVESFLASFLLHHHLSLPLPPPSATPRPHLRQLVEALSTRDRLSFAHALARAGEAAEELFGAEGKGEKGWTWEEVGRLASGLGVDEGWLGETFGPGWIEVEATHYHLLARTRHVLSEAGRVLAFRSLCLSHASSAAAAAEVEVEVEAAVLRELGQIMDASMASCDEAYDCSSAELNALVQVCREEGAVGSRLTGAGWGGCAVSLLPPSTDIHAFRQALRRKFKPYEGLSDEELERAVLESKPGSGAGVYKVV